MRDNIFTRLATAQAPQLENHPALQLLLPSGDVAAFSRAELLGDVCIWAEVFRLEQIAKGEQVIIILDHVAALYSAFLAAIMRGCKPSIFAQPSVKVNSKDYLDNLAQLLLQAEAKYVVTHSSVAEMINQHSDLSHVQCIVTDVLSEDWAHVKGLDYVLDLDAAFIQYSSGTTGLKKGVVISHQALLWQLDHYASAIQLNTNDHIVSWLPLYHDMGLITGFLLPILQQIPVTAISPFDWVAKPAKLLQALATYHGTLCWLPNFAFLHLVKRVRPEEIAGLDLSHVRGFISCAEPISIHALDQFYEKFKDYGVKREALASSYAMAENVFSVTSGGFAGGLKTINVDEGVLASSGHVVPGNKTFVSSGQVINHVSVKICDNNRDSLPENHLGEIAIQSPGCFSAYYKNNCASEAAIKEGWYYTGDMGFLKDNELYVVGRKKDLIIIAGKNYFPEDIEAIVSEVSGVIPGRCVALGEYHESLGTEELIILAETTLTDTAEKAALQQAIYAAINTRLQVTPNDIALVPHMWLKKSTSGKIARAANLQRYQETLKTLPPDSLAKNTEGHESLVIALIQEITGIRLVKGSAELLSSGLLDSLKLVTLISKLEEHLGKELPSPAEVGLRHFDSVSAMVKLLANLDQYKEKRVNSLSSLDTKTENYLDSERAFDCIILGSSRSMFLDTKVVNKFGYKAYNFSVDGGLAEDFYYILKLVSENTETKLKKVILGVDIPSFSLSQPVSENLSISNFYKKYYQHDESQLFKQKHSEEVITEVRDKERATRIMLHLRFHAWDENVYFEPSTGDKKIAPGLKEDVSEEKLRNAIPTINMQYSNYTQLHPDRVEYFAKLVQLCQDNEIELAVFIPPLNKSLRDILSEKTHHLARLADIIDLCEHRDVLVQDYSDVSIFAGDPEAFIDPLHIGPTNSKQLLEHLLVIQREKG